jgi:hypothetical protein
MSDPGIQDQNSYPGRTRHGLTGGLIVLGLGLYFLLVNLDILPPARKTWPVILIVVGVVLIIPKLRRPSK